MLPVHPAVAESEQFTLAVQQQQELVRLPLVDYFFDFLAWSPTCRLHYQSSSRPYPSFVLPAHTPEQAAVEAAVAHVAHPAVLLMRWKAAVP